MPKNKMPGLNDDLLVRWQTVTEEQYRAPAQGVNKSLLWEMRKSPAHYLYAMEHPRKDTAAFAFGRALHCSVLTPERFAAEFVEAPDINRRTAEGKARYQDFIDRNAGKTILGADDMETITDMTCAIIRSKKAHELLENTFRELPCFWTDADHLMPLKCRFDAIAEDGSYILDIKTTTDASNGGFIREALRYGYDVQAAMYCRGAMAINGGTMPKFYFIAIEKAAPYAINVIRASDAFIDRGTWTLDSLLDKLCACIQSGQFPAYGENETVLPEWAEIPEE